MRLNWTGPNINGLHFKMLLIHDENNYWFNVRKKILSDIYESYNSITNYEQVENQNSVINRIECGHTKGCTFWPIWAENLNDCVMFVSYNYSGLYIKYELSALFDLSISSNSYIQVRFMNIDHLNSIQVYLRFDFQMEFFK